MKIIKFILCVSLPLIVGAVSGYYTSQGIKDWYVGIVKPSFNPPNYVFGPVWTVLYILMGISLYMIWNTKTEQSKKVAFVVFAIQLFLNFWWSAIFFYWQQIGWALVEIICIWFSIITMIYFFYRINKTAALLQIPYLLWVTFASVLNYALWKLN